MPSDSCPSCARTSGIAVDSYKHRWWTCWHCGTTRRTRRRDTLFARAVPVRLARRTLPTRLADLLYPVEDVIADERHFYDYYAGASALEPSSTKWAEQIETVTTRLREHGASFEGREVLDVSGGPGFLTAHFLAHGARRAVVTEFSRDAVAGMVRQLGVDAVEFDYQSNRLPDVVSGPFDVVVIDYSINFCLDLAAFTTSLREVVRPGGYVYISWVHPTMGCFLRWQFDEYTYNALFTVEVMDAAFAKAGFRVRAQMTDEPYDYRAGLNLGKRILVDAFGLWYRAKTPKGPVPFSRSLDQRASVRLYELAA
jgi:SAM-dependent methyltransferase